MSGGIWFIKTTSLIKRINFEKVVFNIFIFIKNHNLWVKNLESNSIKQLTFNGYKDYGYGTNNAGCIRNNRPVLKWSPDSKTIVTFRQDAREVGEMYLASTNVGHPKLEKWKYALPGDKKIFEIERIFINIIITIWLNII